MKCCGKDVVQAIAEKEDGKKMPVLVCESCGRAYFQDESPVFNANRLTVRPLAMA